MGVSSPKYLARLPGMITETVRRNGPLPLLQLAADVLEELPARERDVKAAVRQMLQSGLLVMLNPSDRGTVTNHTVLSLTSPTA